MLPETFCCVVGSIIRECDVPLQGGRIMLVAIEVC